MSRKKIIAICSVAAVVIIAVAIAFVFGSGVLVDEYSDDSTMLEEVEDTAEPSTSSSSDASSEPDDAYVSSGEDSADTELDVSSSRGVK